MAQETKVGLLAGLAFIICFAVILTNRGNERFSNAEFGQPPDGPSTRAAAPSRVAAPSQVTTPPRPNSTANKIAQGNPGSPQAGWQQTTSTREAISNPNPTVVIHPVWRTPPASQDTSADPAFGGRNHENTRIAGAAEDSARTSARQDRLARRLDELAAEVRNQRLANGGNHPDEPAAVSRTRPSPQDTSLSARSTPVAANRRNTQYTVVSGDSLSKIARMFYGTGSRTVVNAIFDANRAVLPSVDQLRAGLKIKLPSVAGIDGPRSDRAQPSSASPAPGQPIHRPNRAKPRDTQWYEIKKNDRYAKIAREQLGDESRWREIFELNKDKFPKPGMIRPGVRIKLPARRVASVGDGRH